MTDRIIAGRYRIERLLGRGAMGDVWLAHDLELERPLALKLLGSEADPARFEREARAAAALAHPNVVRLYDYGGTDGERFMVFEYLPGGTLEDLLAPEEPLPDERTAAIAAQIAAGLAHAHARGVVHRDLKPANILFDEEGHPKIADFGIARLGGVDTLTDTGTVLGTAGYISPEQASGQPATSTSDVYSFGVILFRMLTGRLPFEAPSIVALALKHRNEQAPPVRMFRPDAPADLVRITEAALMKDPAARPPDGAALAAELGVPGETLGASVADTVVLRRGRSPRAWVTSFVPLAAGLLLLAAAGIAVALMLTHASTNTPALPTAPVARHHHTTSTAQTTTSTTTTSTSTTGPTTTHSATTIPTTVPTTTPTTVPTTTAPTTTAPTTTTPGG